jgi:hypothetical protein
MPKETLDKLIPFMVRPFDKALLSVAEGLTTHHERNQPITVRPELFEGSLSRGLIRDITLGNL